MGTKVQFESYMPAHYSMKDLNHESNGASWPSCFGECNLSNGQFYYGFLPRTVADSQPGYDKDIVKQTMLEHEVIFKKQVCELHRLYRKQRDLMDEVRRKEQFKHQTPYEASSSSSPVPYQMQYEDVHRWNDPNIPLSSSGCGRPPVLAPDTVHSSPYSAKGKSIQAGPSLFPNCYSPKNSESDSRPTKLRRMLDLQLPADEYIDTDEVEQVNGLKVYDTTSPSPDKNRMFTAGNGKLFMEYPGKIECQGDASKSDLHVSKPRALADLNEPLHVEEATSVSSVDFLDRGVSHCDVQFQYRDLSSRLINASKDVPQNPNNGSMNGTLNNFHLGNRANGPDWFCYPLESENKGSIRSINQGICPEKVPIPSQPVHILLNQACQPPAFLISDVKGGPWKEKSVGTVEKSGTGCSLSHYNAPGSVASHLPNQPGFFHPSDLGKSLDHCASSWGKPGNFLGQKLMSVRTSPYPTPATLSKSPQSSAQSNDFFGNNKWNLKNSPLTLGTDIPVRNGFYEGSSYAYRGVDYVNSNYSDKKVPSSSINCFKATSCTTVNPVKDMNLNVALPNGVSDDCFSRQGVRIIDNDHKSEDPLAVLPWFRGKGVCSNEAENSRTNFNSLESALSRWGSSVASNSCQSDVKAKILNSDRKILGVPIFGNPPTPKREISKPLIVHNCSGNRESGISGRKGVFDMNLPCDPTEEEVVIEEEKIQTESGSLRHHFDLNSCITEEEIPCEISLPENRTPIRVGTGIDLEAPVILDDEEFVPLDGDSSIKVPEKLQYPHHNADDELAETAALAIISISSFVNLNQSEDTTCLQVDTHLDDPLQWFVDIACSYGNDHENGDWQSEDLDDFELMTLRQKECSVEDYFPKTSFPDVPNVEEKGARVLTTTRARKGHGRRGRQRRDFQRDILPGLTSLSRHEVTEDLQMFGGLMRAIGQPWQSGPNRRNATRNGCARGRRRAVTVAVAAEAAAAPALANTVCALPLKQQNLPNNNAEAVLEDRSLTGWGKTRRPRRQRYPAGNPAPPPVPLT